MNVKFYKLWKMALPVLVSSALILSCSSTTSVKQDKTELIKTASGISYKDLKKGSGKAIKYGSKVSVHYILKNLKGEIFEDSYKSNLPLSFTVGSDAVVKGLDEGVVGMKVGGHRIITIPPELGFQGRNILSNDKSDTIIIEVEILTVE